MVGSSYHFYFFVYACLKREKFVGKKKTIYANFYQLSPIESTGIERPNNM